MKAKYPRIWQSKTGRGVRVHRLVAQTLLGRSLAPGEVVHHRNGDKSDNRACNLQVLPSQRAHMLLEHLERRERRGIVPLFERDVMLEAGGEFKK